MTVRPSRLAFLPLLAALALVSGCGSKATTSGSTESGATVVGEGALAFVSVDSDLGSSQWQQLDKLAQKFPVRDQALAKLKLELAKQHLDYDQDVKPALGPEVDVVVAGARVPAGTASAERRRADDQAGRRGQIQGSDREGELVGRLDRRLPRGERLVRRLATSRLRSTRSSRAAAVRWQTTPPSRTR